MVVGSQVTRPDCSPQARKHIERAYNQPFTPSSLRGDELRADEPKGDATA